MLHVKIGVLKFTRSFRLVTNSEGKEDRERGKLVFIKKIYREEK